MEENTDKLWNKNVNDLTVRDTLVLSAGSMAVSVVLIAGIAGVSAGYEKLSDWYKGSESSEERHREVINKPKAYKAFGFFAKSTTIIMREKGLIMNKAWDKIKKAWEENPITVIVVASFAATAAAKLLDSATSARNSNAWKKEVDRRDRMTR